MTRSELVDVAVALEQIAQAIRMGPNNPPPLHVTQMRQMIEVVAASMIP